MNMARAFNFRMMTDIDHYSISEGTFDEHNDYTKGKVVKRSMSVVITTGNRFSQFDEGVALKTTQGGYRFSDFKSLWAPADRVIKMNDKIGYMGLYYNVLQKSDETTFNFRGYLIEKAKKWTPYA